ncbi:MAG: AgmX/PglI C-terminal domain-containing protein [Labilithrix sp.]|nr:AgmX/PglI C-terminal domain-containing protein [Labilithrix sp.]MCW5810688.1 AgmX/PglI C-terminal domain-containing protein [Labilithrix sp.]
MASKAPPPSSPAGVPSGNGKYIGIAVVLVAIIGGVSVWKLTQKPPEPVTTIIDAGPPAPSVTYTGRNPEDDIGLPPPVVDAGPAKVTNSSGGAQHGASQCDVKQCNGKSTSELETALNFRVRQAHRCYDNALGQDPTLRGKIVVAVRVGANGTTCPSGVSIASNEMGSSTVAQCVAGYFRGASFSAPQGGCVDINIPINFVPRQ